MSTSQPDPGEDRKPTDETCCIRCHRVMHPWDTGLLCSHAPDGGPCEAPHLFGAWLPSVTVRQGSSLHASICDRSDPSAWLPRDVPCSCGNGGGESNG